MNKLKAVFFDQDGVIIDTERDGHRVAFNRAMAEAGLDVSWDEQAYHKLLQIGGGKERLKHDLRQRNLPQVKSEQELNLLVTKIHARKTELFIEMIEKGDLPLRPGVNRLMREIKKAGLFLGICTTSHERSARAVRNTALRDIDIDFILAGDVVPRKKPDPAIYELALEQTSLDPSEAIVIEDSHIGMSAAKSAGLKVIVTTNPYTESEQLDAADLVVNHLGEIDVRAQARGSTPASFSGLITLQVLAEITEASS
jgi:HAD superfamily hydrolase (TIGR01509 family)